jgi:uncharacterized protein YbbC (DUF1343 family)
MMDNFGYLSKHLKNIIMKNWVLIFILFSFFSIAQPLPASENIPLIIKELKGKKVGLVVNQTSMVKNTHLIDTLLYYKINIQKIFGPEHGFRGTADAGEKVNNEIDAKTQISVVSLYGKNKKPTKEQLENLDIIVFDIQDVGCRFYTYISTLHYVMEACAENNKELLILDRPNPNGMYVAGPVLDTAFRSFVGMHPVPIVHGMTIGEYAQMMAGEKWIPKINFKIIPCKNYSHRSTYSLPIKPSPNLPNDLSISLYPSLCLFEGTNVSVARGTYFPFQAIGFPDSTFGTFSFVPESILGMAKEPMHQGKKCYGIDFRNQSIKKEFTLSYLIQFYKLSTNKETYFNNFFKKLIGNNSIQEQIKNGLTEKEITQIWLPKLLEFKKIRKKYLLYEDFE